MSVFENAVMPVGNTSLFEILARLEEAGLPNGTSAKEIVLDYLQKEASLEKKYTDLINGLINADAASDDIQATLTRYLNAELLDYLPSQLKPLVETIDRVTADEGRASVSWNNLPSSQLPSTFSFPGSPLKLDITLNANASLSCLEQLNDEVPGHGEDEYLTPELPASLAITSFQAAMNMRAEAAVGLPVNYGSLALGSGVQLGIAPRWFWLHQDDERWYQAVVEDFKRFPNLFSTAAIQQVIDAENTQGVRSFHGYSCELERGVSFDGAVELGLPSRLLAGGIAHVGLSVGYGVTFAKPVLLQVYRYQKDNEGWLNIQFKAQNRKTDALSLGLGVEIDVQARASAASLLLKQQLGKAAKAIDLLQGEALVRGYITDPAFQLLAGLDGSEAWQNIVTALKQDMTAQELASSWKAEIDGHIDDASESAQKTLMDKLSEALIQRAAGLPDGALKDKAIGKIPELSKQVSAKLVDMLERKLDRVVNDLIANHDSNTLMRLAEGIEEAGIEIDTQADQLADQINNNIAPLKTMLKQYRALLEDLQKPLEDAAKSRIKATLGYQKSTVSDKRHLVNVSIKETALETYQTDIDQLLAGKIKPIVKAAKANQNIRLHEGIVSSLTEREVAQTAELVLVDFEISAQDMLSQKVEFVVNSVTGEITVVSSVSAHTKRTWGGNKRSVRVNNSFISRQGSQSSELSIYRVGTQTQLLVHEFENTLRAIGRYGFIAGPRGVSSAVTAICDRADDIAFKGKEALHQASINFSVVYAPDQVAKILTPHPDGHKQLVQKAANNLQRYGFIKSNDLKFVRDYGGEFSDYARSPSELFVYFYINKYTNIHQKFDHDFDIDMRNYTLEADRTKQVIDAYKFHSASLKSMQYAFQIMSEIYHATPTEHSESWYQERSRDLGKQLARWIDLSLFDTFLDSVNLPDGWLTYDSISSKLLLLQATLADMAGVEQRSDLNVVLSLTYQENGETQVLPLV